MTKNPPDLRRIRDLKVHCKGQSSPFFFLLATLGLHCSAWVLLVQSTGVRHVSSVVLACWHVHTLDMYLAPLLLGVFLRTLVKKKNTGLVAY